MIVETPTIVNDMNSWQATIEKSWEDSQKQLKTLKVSSLYQALITCMILPIIPETKEQYQAIITVVKQTRYGNHILDRFRKALRVQVSKSQRDVILKNHFLAQGMSEAEREAIDWLLVATGTVEIAATKAKNKETFTAEIIQELRASYEKQSGSVRVTAEIISSDENIMFAGRDINLVQKYYTGNKPALRTYLAALRSEWDYPELGSILPGHNRQVLGTVRLHRLYTQADVLDEEHYNGIDLDKLNKLRFKAIEHDVNTSRRPVLDVIAVNPRLVITGGPGNGKSSLCRYLTTCLAYACDPKAEKRDKVNGLENLGAGWVHGAILPIYIRLRNFSASEEHFPLTPDDATAKNLMNYLYATKARFAQHLENYLVHEDTKTYSTILILDGLDEVYRTQDRLIIQSVIENWADTYPNCRIVVTSRTYAYKHDATWRLSERFASAELVPFSGEQIHQYVKTWYQQAALMRPSTFGGSDTAIESTKELAANLIATIKQTPSLYPLAKQPLMLAMLTLIHEDNRRLPRKRAELYDQTVDLLDRWNIPIADDKLAAKLKNIQLDRVRAALKLAAFRLHKRQLLHHRHPTAIERKDLLDSLLTQQTQGDGLGAAIEDVLEYLNTRNGILVSDEIDTFRFPHLSIQEYLAACALIELYDECEMPKHLKPTMDTVWTFPDNLVALLRDDPYRWRNITLFAGSIVAADTGQDRRWNLIEALLPDEIISPLPDEFVQSTYVASEIWSELWLKPRTRSQRATCTDLRACLQAIKDDHRLDAPERSNIVCILEKLKEGCLEQ